MGCTQSNTAISPNIPQQHITRLLQVADINHQLNVNKKYQHLSKILQSKKVGNGLKTTFAYECLTTKQQLLLKRKQFWETRVNGNPECWNILHAAVNAKSDDQIYSLVNKIKLYPLSESIQMCVDQKGNKYELPIFVINDPLSFSFNTLADKNLIQNFEKCDIKVKIRSVKFPNQDLVLDARTDSTILDIKNSIIKAKSFTNATIRLFFNGREMHDNKNLGNYGYVNENIIQAMIKD